MRVRITGADEQLAHALNSVDGSVETVDEASDTGPAELLIAVGEAALEDCAAHRERRPILPVGFDAAWSPAVEELPAFLEEFVESDITVEDATVDVRPLVVSVDGRRSIAVFDTTLITSEPARISEYGVSVGRQEHVTFRADGVVVATPVGSHGYGRAAGGPQLAFGTGVTVVPIAPFATIADTWVLKPPLSVSVERDDPVTVFADTTEVATGRSELCVAVTTGRPLSLVDGRRLADSP